MKFLRERLARMMAGRYGTDRLNRILSGAVLVLLVLSLFTKGGGFGTAIWLLALAGLIWSSFRTFSRNIAARQRENAAWLRLEQKLTGGFRGWKTRFRQRKDYRFFPVPPAAPGCGCRKGRAG